MDKQFSYWVIVCALMSAFILGACGGATRPIPTNIPPTSQVALPTLTTSPPEATYTPQPSRTVAAQPTGTPTASPTPYPTLAPDEIEPAVLTLLNNNGGCQLPCWWGLTPGDTRWDEAERFLRQFNQPIELTRTAAGNPYAHIGIPVSRDLSSLGLIGIELSVRDGKVDQIFVGDLDWSGFQLADLLETLGPPGEVWISTTNWKGSNIIPFFLVLYYPEQGLLAKYADLVSVEGSKITGCLRFGLDLYLWSPDRMEAFQEASLKLQAGLDTSGYRPLSEVTAFDVQRFYERYSDRDQVPCIETPARFWPYREG